uniref:Peptidase S1 domain-containing protein n=1 Tax=Acrobeloides nanus TaxID=290746 RepID=A0A914CVF4_9BILA
MELKFLLLTSLFYFNVLGDHECGISYTQEVPTSYTINKPSQIGMWPWAVSMHFNGQKLCSGVIISPRYVLTAAHCYNHAMSNKDTKRRHFSIHAGTIYANEGEVVRVKNVTTYDNHLSEDMENDIALLEVGIFLVVVVCGGVVDPKVPKGKIG